MTCAAGTCTAVCRSTKRCAECKAWRPTFGSCTSPSAGALARPAQRATAAALRVCCTTPRAMGLQAARTGQGVGGSGQGGGRECGRGAHCWCRCSRARRGAGGCRPTRRRRAAAAATAGSRHCHPPRALRRCGPCAVCAPPKSLHAGDSQQRVAVGRAGNTSAGGTLNRKQWYRRRLSTGVPA